LAAENLTTLAYLSVSVAMSFAEVGGRTPESTAPPIFILGSANVTVSMRTVASIEKPRRAEAERGHCQERVMLTYRIAGFWTVYL